MTQTIKDLYEYIIQRQQSVHSLFLEVRQEVYEISLYGDAEISQNYSKWIRDMYEILYSYRTSGLKAERLGDIQEVKSSRSTNA